jgi:hypothetical protein
MPSWIIGVIFVVVVSAIYLLIDFDDEELP